MSPIMTINAHQDRYGQAWTHDELVLAFELYCRIPFRMTKANNPHVKELARLLQRSPASVARKLGNFGALDPELRKHNISGLPHTSKLDKKVWDEFHSDWNELVLKAHDLRRSLGCTSVESEVIERPDGPSERVASVKQRLHQSFFRAAVLSSYEQRCCVTGIDVPECLVACHIVPWSKEPKLRTDPSNGLCLSATFDRLFDQGLMTVSEELVILISGPLLRTATKEVRSAICVYHEKPIIRPRRFLPSSEHLRWHRCMFVSRTERLFKEALAVFKRSSVGSLVEEYKTLAQEARLNLSTHTAEDQRLTEDLSREGAWTREGATHLVNLARENGVFVLRNALALAIALEQEDGSLGY